MRFKIPSFLLLLLLSQFSVAQVKTLPQITPPGPESQKIQRYDDYPVSLATGIPAVEIPFFEIAVGDLKIPVALSYHSSGFRPNDAPGIAGEGWSLSAGGSISRTISGLVDERSPDPVRFSFQNATDDWDYLNKVVNKTIDTQHDIFSCQLPGGSAKMVWDRGGTNDFVTLPYKPWKIDPTLGLKSGAPAYTAFVVRDELGRIYTFGGDDAYREEVLGTSPTGFDLGYTGWYLKRISLPYSDETINFNYTKLNPAGGGVVDIVSPAVESVYYNVGASNSPISGSFSTGSARSYTTKVLTEIAFPTGKIVFEYNAASYPDNYLKKVSLLDLNGTLQKAYELVQAKGLANRWFLNEIRMLDKDQVKIGSYLFTYYAASCSFTKIGPTYSSVDFYGFHNGASNNSMMPPVMVPQSWLNATPIMKGGNANRNPNAACAKAGVLQEITYPTQGKKTFDYEGNSVSITSGGVTTQKALSGLRVKRITNTSEKNTFVRDYVYSGASYTDLRDEFFATGAKVINISPNEEFTQYTLSSEPYVNLFLPNGAPVLYRTVTEYFGTTDVNEGRIVHEFDAERLGYNSYFYNVIYGSKIFNDGLSGVDVPETRTSYFKKSGTDTLRVIKKNISFDQLKRFQDLQTYQQVIYPQGCSASICHTNAEEFARANASIFQLVQRLKSTIVTDYAGQQSITTRTNYFYEGKILSQPSREEITGSDGKKTTEYTYYPLDYAFASTVGYLANMITNNVLLKPVEKVKKLTNGSNVSTILSATFSSYKGAGTGLLDRIYQLEVDTPVPLADFKFFNAAQVMDTRYKERLQYTSYDSKGNVLELTTPELTKVSYTYGQGLKKFPVTETKNAGSAEVYYESFEDGTNIGVAQADAKSGTRVKASGFTCTFVPPNNRNYTLSYWYRSGTSGTWTYYLVKDIPGSAFGSYTTLSNGAYIDEVRVHPSDAEMTSFSFDLFKGMTSSNDLNGSSTYYDYDSFQRLKLIKDNDLNILKTFEYNYKTN